MTEKKNVEYLRSKFLKTYAQVPLNLRNEIVAVVEDGPVSWSVAYVEVLGKSEKGNMIIELMDKLELLGD